MEDCDHQKKPQKIWKALVGRSGFSLLRSLFLLPLVLKLLERYVRSRSVRPFVLCCVCVACCVFHFISFISNRNYNC
jgi:hypothetical protein